MADAAVRPGEIFDLEMCCVKFNTFSVSKPIIFLRITSSFKEMTSTPKNPFQDSSPQVRLLHGNLTTASPAEDGNFVSMNTLVTQRHFMNFIRNWRSLEKNQITSSAEIPWSVVFS